MPGRHVAEARMAPTMAAISRKLMLPLTASLVGGLRLPDRRHQPVVAVVPDIDHDEDREHHAGDERRLEPQMLQRPEEIDPVQEADEQRRVAERGQRAADIGDQKDEEHDDVDVVEPVRVRADERTDQDHGRAGGADNARAQRAEAPGSRC